MKTDAGFVEHIKGIDQTGAQGRGQRHPLDFTAGKGARLPIKGQIAQADIFQIGQPAADLLQYQQARFIPGRNLQRVEKINGLIHVELVHLRDGAAGQPIKQGFIFEARTVAIRTNIVTAVATARGRVTSAEALAYVVLEASDQPLVVTNVDLSRARIGGLSTDVGRRFLDVLAERAGLVLHVRLLNGTDSGHVLEAIFKGLGAALAQACERREAQT